MGRPRVTWKRTVLAELHVQNVSWKEAKQMAKNSLLAKICDGLMLHLGTTGNDDDGFIHDLPLTVSLDNQELSVVQNKDTVSQFLNKNVI
jgi:hypothetical protein